jgi:CCR4-NOT transcription complex subunit 6
MMQLPLSSAYSKVAEASNAHDAKLAKQKQRLDPKQHEPLFTNITKDFRGTLDYILYTSNSLMPTAVLELPSEVEVVAPNEQMPNAQYSSDHLALMSEFQYIRPK